MPLTGDGHPVALLCQYRVSGGGDRGDSGSPVFAWISDIDPVQLYGVIWGGDKTHYTFSSMYYLQQELGRLITYGTEPTESGDPDPGCGTQIIC
jgi:hypothetical protein